MSAAHTPGPWVVNTAGHAIGGMPFAVTEIYVYAPNTQDDTAICADVIDPVTQEPSEANARLIAESPNLLKALTDLVANQDATWVAAGYRDEQIKAMPYLKPAREAIAKAGGAA